jgi:hypothetical protein
MKKEKVTKVEDKIDDEKLRDKEEIIRLGRIVNPSSNDMTSIYTLYKKYVNSGAQMYRAGGCNTCGNSIVTYWRKLIDWYGQNRGQF